MKNFIDVSQLPSFEANPQERQGVEFSEDSRVTVYTSFSRDYVDPENVLNDAAFERTVEGMKVHYSDYISGKLGLHDWQVTIEDNMISSVTIEGANYQHGSDICDMETQIYNMMEGAWASYEFHELDWKGEKVRHKRCA